MEIKISVVVPTYKRPALLQSCLKNLHNQTFPSHSFELIIVSDGQDKETMEAISTCKACSKMPLIYLSLPVKSGPAAARNLGWRHARGTLIAFTDDDCLPDPTWLENIWNPFNEESIIAFTGKVIVPVSRQPTDFELNTKGLETGSFVTANCACTKAALEAVGGFDEDFTAAWREDSDLEFKFLNHSIPIIKLNDAIVIHPVRKVPWGISMKEQRKTAYNALLYKKHPLLYRQRIKKGPVWSYYLTILFFLLFLLLALLRFQWPALIAFAGWLALTLAFAGKRLAATRKTPAHIFEMTATSIAIPFLSVFYTIYGAIKYRVLFF